MNGNRAITEWRFTGTKADGTKVNTRGCDVFVISDGKNRHQRHVPKGRRLESKISVA
jgi:hypothetical protein